MTVTYETIRQPRKMTAAEAAERLGVTPRTIRRYQAEAREDFLTRSADRQRIAYELHMQGMTWQQVGEHMNCTTAAARQLGHRWRTANGIEPKENPFKMGELMALVRKKPTETSAERYAWHLKYKPEQMEVTITISRDEYAALLMSREYDFRALDDVDAANLAAVMQKVQHAANNPPPPKRSHHKKPAAVHGQSYP